MAADDKNTGDNRLWRTGGPGYSSATDKWATPQAVFDTLDAEFHFELDACASPENAKCARYYTVTDDGLTQPWKGVVWCNPPYQRGDEGTRAWMRKAVEAAEAGATVVCLIPSRTGPGWWHESVMEAAEIRLVQGRLKFGDGKASAPFDSAIAVFRPGHEGPPRFLAVSAKELMRPVEVERKDVPPASSLARVAKLDVRRSAKKASSPRLALATAKSSNRKIGEAATTYAAQTSCPSSCRFLDGGCYAEAGSLGKFVTAPLNAAAQAVTHTALDVAYVEAAAIDALKIVPGRPLRLHTVGDCASDEAAQVVSAAAERYRARGGGPVWTYTHAWREVVREAWGEVSILASCETPLDVRLAKERGYAAALVVEEFSSARRYHRVEESAAAAPSEKGGSAEAADTGAGQRCELLPCPAQTRHVSCTDCRLCFDDTKLRERGYAIGFELHGTPFTVRQARKALLTPDDPERRLTTRQLIPRLIAEIEAEGRRVTNSELARRLNCSPSSVTQMRKTLAREAEAEALAALEEAA